MQDTVLKKKKSQNKNKKVLFGIVLLLLLVAGGLTYYFGDSFSQSPKKYDDDISKALRGLYNDEKWEKKFEEDYQMSEEDIEKKMKDAEDKYTEAVAKKFDYLPKECQEQIRDTGKEDDYKQVKNWLKYRDYDWENKYQTLADDFFMTNDAVASPLTECGVQEMTWEYWWALHYYKKEKFDNKQALEAYKKQRKETIFNRFFFNVELLGQKSLYETKETYFGITNTKKKPQTEKSFDDMQQSLRTFYTNAFFYDHIMPRIKKIQEMTETKQEQQLESMKTAYEKALWKIVESLPSDLKNKVIDDMKEYWHVKEEESVEKKYIEAAKKSENPIYFFNFLDDTQQEEAMNLLIQDDAFWLNVESCIENKEKDFLFTGLVLGDFFAQVYLHSLYKRILLNNYCKLFIDTKATIEFLKTLNVVQGEENNINQEVSKT